MHRALAWKRLKSGEPFDLLVVGGGVTGAGVLFEAARRGLRAILVERKDFASGTSSKSSKLIHGGLRYLKEGNIGLTREAVRERQELLRAAPGLVEPVWFVVPHYRGRRPGRATTAFGLALYDLLAATWQHRYAGAEETLRLVPSLDRNGLLGAHCYLDATTDDARLVLRLIAQACDSGAVALNYANAELLRAEGRVCGARVTDATTGDAVDVRARAVINATGVFADELRSSLGERPRLRPLRGSHLVLEGWRLPLAQAVAFEHPYDRRLLFAYPWLGRTLVGTTDLDHDAPLDDEPSISTKEVIYLLAAAHDLFPGAHIERSDIIATYAGVRPIVDDTHGDPSKASRDHAVWEERGLVTITGGKLTTFRPMAMDALAAAAPHLPPFDRTMQPAFTCTAGPENQWLSGRYGSHASELVACALRGELDSIGSTPFYWAEVRYAARNEAVVHLDDLLLRRTRLGLLSSGGGATFSDRIEGICRDELGWDADRRREEVNRYRELWRSHYFLPPLDELGATPAP
jgi:glycerol-3-phosphate dehydrogenase